MSQLPLFRSPSLLPSRPVAWWEPEDDKLPPFQRIYSRATLDQIHTNDYLAIGNLTELDADDFTIHDEPSDARVFRFDEEILFIAYETPESERDGARLVRAVFGKNAAVVAGWDCDE